MCVLENEQNQTSCLFEFFVKKGLALEEVSGDAAPSKRVVFKWALDFKRGRTSIEDNPHSARPKYKSKYLKKFIRAIGRPTIESGQHC